VQFFSNSACDPSGYGEGQTYLGEILVTSGTKVGSTSFTFDSLINLSEGLFISATVEHPTLGTSEFGPCFDSINTPAGSNVAVDLGAIGNEVALTFDDVTTGGSTTVSMALQDLAHPAAIHSAIPSSIGRSRRPQPSPVTLKSVCPTHRPTSTAAKLSSC